MAGHPSLHLTDERKKKVLYLDKEYEICLSFHKLDNIDGDVVGLKFTDAKASMDASKKVNLNGPKLGKFIAQHAVQMLGNLDNISFLGFYLLTDEIVEERGFRAALAKERIYNTQAIFIHDMVREELPYHMKIKAEGGVGWGMSKENLNSIPQYRLLISELGKEITEAIHADPVW
ncbi:hypothetical protein EDC56_1523 [Sinobacterium caligoides]|uniref:Uncharacterized protein n=1 Tax=Sinobacterium caligoides TaxID=933926 RepID=A0A3N2DMR2_9GAMM|nr:hypothetical protein [Sinobacterium caligoides]ROS01097.1 hypothetical protein EDC56_1523 [Sinobacterium caligoides]